MATLLSATMGWEVYTVWMCRAKDDSCPEQDGERSSQTTQ